MVKLFPSVCALVLTTACHGTRAQTQTGPAVVVPGAPGEPSRVVSSARPAPVIKHTEADVKFMQGMIGHHAQALDMTALLKTRTGREDMKLLALRIDVSQSDEIKMMQRWLEARRLEVPGPHAHHMAGARLMPGMLTPEDMARLEAASGADFDKLFLQYMIRHHEGALVMVKELFSAGGGQPPEVFAFASDVEADQQAEIDRMRNMLAAGK
jgi:uncharacterized protein (DUF305 family)